jgi:methylated-DNA-[protein]-cysteine S-methyltransferase
MAVDYLDGWGWCGVAADSGRVIASTIGQPSAAAASSALEKSLRGLRGLDIDLARAWLERLHDRLSGAAGNDPELDLMGTDFQNRIWQACRDVPVGETRAYGWIARSAGYSERRYARAVGAALGANPALVFVPCHRVVSANGDLGGYAAGRDLKRKLLTMERIQAADA